MVKPFGRKVVGHRHGGTGVGTSENVPFSKKSSQKVSFSKEGNGTQQSASGGRKVASQEHLPNIGSQATPVMYVHAQI